MEISNKFIVQVNYQTTSCIDRYSFGNPVPPKVDEENIYDLINILEENGYSIDKDASEKISTQSKTITFSQSLENEGIENTVLRSVILKGTHLEIVINNFHASGNDGLIGGTTTHAEGVDGKITYQTDDYENGMEAIKTIKEKIVSYYQILSADDTKKRLDAVLQKPF